MKSINFQRNKSLIRIINEKKVRVKRNWDRMLYITLLCSFVLFLIYYAGKKLLYVHANGQVVIESSRIRLTNDARLIDFYVQEGDSVKENDTLFSYAVNAGEEHGEGLTYGINGESSGESKDLWHLKETYNLKKSIAINKTRILKNEQLIKTYNQDIKRLSNEVILDVLPKNRLELLQNDIIKLSMENEQLKEENKTFLELINTIEPLPAKSTYKSRVKYNVKNHRPASEPITVSSTQKLTFTDELLSDEKYFRSPMEGVITRIYIHALETALKSEEILSIHRGHPAYIKTFFDQKDLKHFKIGDVFELKFPDGTVSQGILKRFYIATYQIPEEFQQKYEPTNRTIAGDIFPLTEEDLMKWKIFNKMSVNVTKLIF